MKQWGFCLAAGLALLALGAVGRRLCQKALARLLAAAVCAAAARGMR